MEQETTSRIHSNFTIASLVLGSISIGLFLWLTQVIFYRIQVVIDAFAGRYVTRFIIASSIDGFFILLAVIGLILGIIGLKRKRSSLSAWVIIINAIVIIVGPLRLALLYKVMFVF